ncbi:MAG: ATP phosphoribosyltransferase regulatory subunit, partial [Burkholderiales bacterium]|nr:ATP phosphoribosyltransferase regulatory subunit [Burkholderiales bacterium]
DLRDWVRLAPEAPPAKAILAPYSDDAKLRERIDALRAAGEVVIVELPGHEQTRAELGCDRQLVLKNGNWEIVSL